MDKNQNKNVRIGEGEFQLADSKTLLDKIIAEYKIMAVQKSIFFKAQPLMQKIEDLQQANQTAELAKRINPIDSIYSFKIWNWGQIQNINLNLQRFQASVHEIFILDYE